MAKVMTTVPNDKLLAALRGLSPAALRAVIEELTKLGPEPPVDEDREPPGPRSSR